MDIESNSGSVCEVPRKKKWLRVVTASFHFVLCCYYVALYSTAGYFFYKALLVDNDYIQFMARYAFAFGTNWNLFFQTVFLLLALYHDILEWMNKQDSPRSKKIAYWRDVIYNALVFPYTLFVAIMFWTLYNIDRDLVFPEIFDTVVPGWFNHSVHTNICIIICLETLLTARRQPTDKAMELKILSAVAFGYAVVYYSIYFITNRWLYNVFGIMTWWQVCFFQLLIWTSTYIFYFINFPINRFFHREEKSVAELSQSEDKSMSNGSSNMEVSSNQKNNTEPDSFSAENWNLKYRSLRDKFESSRL